MKNRRIGRSALITALLALSAQVGAATITVNDASDPAAFGAVDVWPQNCLPGSGQACRLRDAVALARGGDTIVFAPHVTHVELFHGLVFSDRSGLPVTVDGGGRASIGVGANPLAAAAIRTTGPRSSNITILRALSVQGHVVDRMTEHSCGGAVVNLGQIRISDSRLSGTASLGGGLCNYGLAQIERSSVNGRAFWGGGGIFNAGVLEMSNSTIYSTHVFGVQSAAENPSRMYGWGASLYNYYGTARLDFVSIGNGSVRRLGLPVTPCGTQVYNRWGDVSIDRSIISVGRTSNGFGELPPGFPLLHVGVCGYPSMAEAPTLVSRSLIEASGGSQAWAHPEWLVDGGSNHDIPPDANGRRDEVVSVQETGGFNLAAIPLQRIHHLVRDAVDCDGAPGTDQRGVPRPQGGLCDMGAVELE
ncbi:MAG: hypothetical protein MEQ07_05455 [Aquimonas sp.]|nr:hypothetical protein [Aquimonas sp.]